MKTAINKNLKFGTKKMTVISELVLTELVNNQNYSMCRAEGPKGGIYSVIRKKDGSYFLIGSAF